MQNATLQVVRLVWRLFQANLRLCILGRYGAIEIVLLLLLLLTKDCCSGSFTGQMPVQLTKLIEYSEADYFTVRSGCDGVFDS